MRAIVMTKFGSPDVLQLQDVAKPVPHAQEVLIRVHATTVFAGDCEMRSLQIPVALRLPFWLYATFIRPRPIILGQELAGQIEAVGKDVHHFKPGDQVFAATGFDLGAYAEYKCMPAEPGGLGGALALKPANLTYAEAAPVAVGGLEALHFVRSTHIQAGEQVLINGAGGSIGTMVVQLARLRGAVVTAIDRAEKLDMLHALGAEHVIDYTQANFTQGGRVYDVIIDVVGKGSVANRMHGLKEHGRYFLGNPTLLQRLRARWAAAGGQRILQGTGAQRAADLLYLKDLIEAGQLKPVIDRRYSLEQMAEAHRYVDTGRKQGSVVITVDDSQPQGD